MANDSMNVGIFITDLLEKERIDDTDILLVEDLENTKKVLFRNFRISLISDKEAPSNYRIYSSQKVHQLIDEIRDSVSDGIGGMEEDIQNLI